MRWRYGHAAQDGKHIIHKGAKSVARLDLYGAIPVVPFV
jgi:hypothetical protein